MACATVSGMVGMLHDDTTGSNTGVNNEQRATSNEILGIRSPMHSLDKSRQMVAFMMAFIHSRTTVC